MQQRIPSWKSISWCSIIRKHCIWISTKDTLKFIWILLSLAFVVKEGECLLSYLWNLWEKKSFFCNSFTEGDYWKRESFLSNRENYFKFHSAMTCCVAINAKKGDCWIQLLIVYFLWCYTNVISVIRHSLPSSENP